MSRLTASIAMPRMCRFPRFRQSAARSFDVLAERKAAAKISPCAKAVLAISKRKSPLRRKGLPIDLNQRMGLQERPPPWRAMCSVDRNQPAQSAGDHVSRLSAGAETNRVAAVGERDGALRKLVVQIERAEHDVRREFPVNAGADGVAKSGFAA
jgi:hypothetical protein